MPQFNNPHRTRDMTLLGGWLFADLLLGLMMIFLVATPRVLPPPVVPVVPPVLTVDPTSLDPTNSHCTGGINAPQCKVTVGETASSQVDMSWMATSDMSNTVNFSPANGTLSPGGSMTVTITAIPCQTGSFTFSGTYLGSRKVLSVMIPWKCTPLPVQLEVNPHRFTLTVHDVNGLLTSSSQDQDIKNQVIGQTFLRGRSVGLVLAYGGAPDDSGIGQAQAIAAKIYTILQSLATQSAGVAFQRASYYVSNHGNLYTLGNQPSVVEVDVYLFMQ